jgi:phosphatidylserine/phosphatidylglycerophosphate/cardiolipin synthase-like enzyme
VDKGSQADLLGVASASASARLFEVDSRGFPGESWDGEGDFIPYERGALFGEAILTEGLAGLLSRTVRQLRISAYTLDHPVFIEMLVSCAQRQVDVRILLDREQFFSGKSRRRFEATQRLLRAGVVIGLSGTVWNAGASCSAVSQHAKFVVRDKGREALVGSFNFTVAACSNFEASVVVGGESAWALHDQWEAWSRVHEVEWLPADHPSFSENSFSSSSRAFHNARRV